MFYRQLRRGVNDSNYQLVPADESQVKLCLDNPKQDFYTSLYKYDQAQYEEFQKTHTIKGVTNVVTDWLVFDFDSKDNLGLAQKDTEALCRKLEELGMPSSALRISFSGGKGFHVEVRLTETLTVEEFKAITKQVAGHLVTFDKLICDHARPFRILGSLNPKTGLYKIPLEMGQLFNLSISEIKELAFDQDVFQGEPWHWPTIVLPPSLATLKSFKEDYKPKVQQIEVGEINWAMKPKWLTNCRYSLQNGYFGEGMRNTAFTCLAATMKNQGFNEAHTYRYLKGVAELQAVVNSCDRYPDELLYNNVITQVYSHGWKGGQYSCRDLGSPLHEYCISLGDNKCKHRDDETVFIEIDQFASKFASFAKNIEQNTLKFGIEEIDNNALITTSMLVGLLGAPSAGKTTLLLNFLEQSNKDKIDSVFFSMDMSLPLVYLRLIQKNFGYSKNQVFDFYKNNPKQLLEIEAQIKEKYKYTKFSFKTALNVEKMDNAVADHEQRIGRKVKLVGVDYLECIHGPNSDPTTNAGIVSNQLKDSANENERCQMLLLQTQKHSGDPSDPLLSMRNVKGASGIEQACTAILTLSRPGFSAVTPEDDKFATISLVKGRLDTLFSKDLRWDGLRGEFSRLEDSDRALLSDIRNRKKDAQAKKNDGWG